MVDVSFQVEGAEPQRAAVTPGLLFKVCVTENAPAGNAPTPIQTVALNCQVRIEPARRRYSAPEEERLLDLFGEPERWGQTVRPLLWTQTSVMVPAFAGAGVCDLPVPCSQDLMLAASKYFYGLEEGEIPLSFLFSGTIFYAAEDGLRVTQIPWNKEASFRLPLAVWQQLMDRFYPHSTWLCLQRDVFDRLYRYKSSHGLPTWERALEELLDSSANPQTAIRSPHSETASP